MELRRAADVLLRCHTSPLPPVLNSSIYTRTKTASITHRANSRRPIERNFTSSSRRSVRFPTVTTSAASEPNKKDEAKEYFKGRFGSITARKGRAQPPALSNEARVNGGYSDSALMTTLSQDARSLGPSSTKGYSFANMITPLESEPVARKPEPLKIPTPLRLTPSTGRTVNVGGHADVGRAFTLLAQTVARNGIKRDFNSQRFHERPGLKRKRLRRVRWRRNFKAGFQAVVQRVQKLRKLGW